MDRSPTETEELVLDFDLARIVFAEEEEEEEEANIVVSLRDITEPKRTEEALRESQERYQAIFDQAADSIVLIDSETGAFVEFNERAHENLGYTRKEFQKLKITDFEIIESAEEVARHIEKIVKDGADSFETKHKNKSGEIRDIHVSSKSISIRGINFVQSMWRDITERKQAEDELRNSRQQLRDLSAYLQSSREQERTSIAREIHDDLGQTLTVLKMDISWLGKRLPKDKKQLVEKTKLMNETLDRSIKTVKRVITDLRPSLLDDLGLIAAVEWQAGDFQNRTGIEFEVTIEPEDFVVDQERSTALFRIFQETLTNITRHADATEVNVSLARKDGEVVMKVSDNGKGITKKEISNTKSFGLLGIRERVHLFGGKMEIKGVKGKGTTVEVRIPVI